MTREEAIKIVKSNWPEGRHQIKEALETLIPELAESEDERIRKAIWLVLVATEEDQDAFYRTHNITRKECTDWLEKQKERPTNEEMLRTLRTEYEKGVADTIAKYEQKEPIPIPDKFSGLKSLMLQYLQSAANRKDDTEIESDTDLWGRKILDYVWKHDGLQKEQKPRWSPSEEQMEYLAKAIVTLGDEGYCKTAMYLSEIRKELKKL